MKIFDHAALAFRFTLDRVNLTHPSQDGGSSSLAVIFGFESKVGQIKTITAQPDKRLAKRTKKKVLCVVAMRQAQSVWFITKKVPVFAAYLRLIPTTKPSLHSV